MCPVNALRVAYTGELGWELHHPIEMQNYLFDRLMEAGEPLGLRLVGARAQNWLRQEKSYRAFGTELGRDATPLEADLPRFVDLSKDFHGKAAMQAKGVRSLCVTLLIDGPGDADPWGREALYAAGGARVGRLTSGGWSVAFGRSIGMGYVGPGHAAVGTRLAGPDAGRALARRGRPRQPLRPGERPHPRRRLTPAAGRVAQLATACSTGRSIATSWSAQSSAAPLTGLSDPSGVAHPAAARVRSRFHELSSLRAASCTAASVALTKRSTQIAAASSARPSSRACAACASADPPVTQPPQVKPTTMVAMAQATQDQNHAPFVGR